MHYQEVTLRLLGLTVFILIFILSVSTVLKTLFTRSLSQQEREQLKRVGALQQKYLLSALKRKGQKDS